MVFSSWVASFIAIAFVIVLCLRLPRLVQGTGNLGLWLTHLGMCVSLWLVVEPVYLGVDRLLGSANLANLLSHLCINFVFLTGGTQVALSAGRKDIAAKIRSVSMVVLPLCATLMSVLFLAADLPYSTMGLNDFRHDTSVVLYKLSLYVYPAVVSAMLVKPLLSSTRFSTRRLPYCSKKLMALGFGLAAVAPLGHLVELANRHLDWLTDVIVYPSMLCVLVGVSLGWLSALRPHRQKVA